MHQKFFWKLLLLLVIVDKHNEGIWSVLCSVEYGGEARDNVAVGEVPFECVATKCVFEMWSLSQFGCAMMKIGPVT